MSLLAVHVGLSLIGIVSGLVVLYGLLTGRALGGWTALFLATTILTAPPVFRWSRSASIRRAPSAFCRWSSWPSRSAPIICFISPASGAGSMSLLQ